MTIQLRPHSWGVFIFRYCTCRPDKHMHTDILPWHCNHIFRISLLLTRVCGVTLSAFAWRWGGDGFNSRPNYLVIAKYVKGGTYCCYVKCATLIVWVGGTPWPKQGTNQYHAQLGLPDKVCAIKGLVFCNSWYLEPWDLLNGLALGCYQPSPRVWLVCMCVCFQKPIPQTWRRLFNVTRIHNRGFREE